MLEATQQRLDQANKELDKLVGVRTRQIQRKLKDVQTPAKELSEKYLMPKIKRTPKRCTLFQHKMTFLLENNSKV